MRNRHNVLPRARTRAQLAASAYTISAQTGSTAGAPSSLSARWLRRNTCNLTTPPINTGPWTWPGL
eukprot:83359-Lingulodinium_polyedra.AAC.1